MRLPSPSRSAWLTRLLVALLLLQWSTAFGHCLRLAAAPARALTVEICTASGLHPVDLPGEHGDGERLAAGLICPACQGPASLAPPPPPIVLAVPVLAALDASETATIRETPPIPRQHVQPRGPPAA